MSTELVLAGALLVVIVSVILTRYAPGMLLDALDHVVMHMPIRPFLAITPTRDPVVGSFVMAAAIVGGFGLILSLSRLTGFWVIWPAAVLLLLLAIGFGVAFASLLWPIVLTAGLIVLRYVLGPLELAGGEPMPFPEDGARVSALNVMIGLTALLSTYASVLASRAREANHKRSGRH
jgi:hypothetical protein